MSLILSSIALNMTAENIQKEKVLSKNQVWLAFILSTLSWTYILFMMVITYRNKTGWLDIVLLITYSLLYSAGYLTTISLITASMMKNISLGFRRVFHLAVTANMPVVAITFISVILQLESGYIKILGYFPEHALILGGYLSIFSHVKLVSFASNKKSIFYLILLTIITYIFLGPLMFNLFKL